MVRDGTFPAHTYFQILRNHIMNEPNQDIVDDQIAYKMPFIMKNYVPEKYSDAEADVMINFLLKEFMPNIDSSEIKQIILSTMISLTSTEKHRCRLQKWLNQGKITYTKDNEEQTVEGVSITPENKYSILKAVSVSKEIEKEEMTEFVEKHLKDDENKDLAHR
jgi:hypothetical protein